jgi:ligand-binding sensor domain-containing protein
MHQLVSKFVKLARVSIIALTHLVIFVSTSVAQFQYRFENISKEQSGLSGASVMLQDSKGFIWFGTGRGMYRFDGYNYRSFVIDPEHKKNVDLNSIHSLYEDHYGKIWIGTGNGPARFDPVTETFETFPFFSERIKSGMLIYSILEDNGGNIWFTMRTDQDTIGGLVFFDHTRSTFEVSNDGGLLHFACGLSLDEQGNLWIASNNGVFIFDPVRKKVLKHFPSILTADSTASKSDVSSVFFEKNGVVWATSHKSGVSQIKYDQSYNLSFRNFQKKDGLMTNDIASMIKDSRGHYWFIATGGLIVLNPDKNLIINLQPSKDNKHALKDLWCN